MITQIQVPWRLWMKACFISVGDGDRLFVAVTEGGAFDVTKAADGAASFGGFDTVETEVLGFEDPAVVTDALVAGEASLSMAINGFRGSDRTGKGWLQSKHSFCLSPYGVDVHVPRSWIRGVASMKRGSGCGIRARLLSLTIASSAGCGVAGCQFPRAVTFICFA